MKITKARLKEIINEETSKVYAQHKTTYVEITEKEPEMVDALCAFGPDLGVETGESIATALGGEQPTFVSSIASTIKFLCGFFIKTSLYPLTSTLNLLAYILRLLSDEQAKIIIDSSRGQEVEEEPVIDPDDTEVPLENA